MELTFEALAEASGIVFGVFGLALAFMACDVDRWPKALCVALLSAMLVRSALALLALAVDWSGVPPALDLAFHVISRFVAPIPGLLVFAYFLWCCGEDYRKSTILRVQVALAFVMSAAMNMTAITGQTLADLFFGAHFPIWPVLFYLLSFAITAICLVALFRRWKKVTIAQRVVFLACFITTPPIQMILVELLLSSDLIRRYLDQKDEAAQQRARIAVLQMRPHFIHNTLTTIYCLNAKDHEAANEALLAFSRYLQNNFSAIVAEDTIPFSKELEHTQAYLAVEQVCHEGRLFVDFDTPVTFFRIAPLTLQPLVENAIKHGVDPDQEPLRVSVTTRDVERGARSPWRTTAPATRRPMTKSSTSPSITSANA